MDSGTHSRYNIIVVCGWARTRSRRIRSTVVTYRISYGYYGDRIIVVGYAFIQNLRLVDRVGYAVQCVQYYYCIVIHHHREEITVVLI